MKGAACVRAHRPTGCPARRGTIAARVEPVDWLSSSAERELKKDPAAGREGALLGPIKVVHALRLSGACWGCGGSATTLKRGVEVALREGFAGFKGIQIHEPTPGAPPQRRAPGRDVIPLVQVGQAPQRPHSRPIFKAVARLEDVPVGTMHAFDAEVPDLASRPEEQRQDFLADMHYTTPSKALILAKALGVLPPKVFIVGCQPVEVDDLGVGLSESVERAAAQTMRKIEQILGRQVVARMESPAEIMQPPADTRQE